MNREHTIGLLTMTGIPSPNQIEQEIFDVIFKEYLGIHNTSENGAATLYSYLVQRTILRFQEKHTTTNIVTAAPWEWDALAWSNALSTDTSEQQVQALQQEGTPTNQFLCTRCGERKCIFSTAQTRSADEGMTTFITCLHCNRNWRLN